MRTIDLTHLMNDNTPVFPGTEKPIFHPANTLEKDGFAETKFSMYSHTGTHIDAPAHMICNTNTLDQLDISHFVGKAIVLDFTNIEKNEITKADLLVYESRLKGLDYVLIRTGWSKYWGDDKYFCAFPFLTSEAAEYLISFRLKGIGIDAISIDSMENKTFPVHNILFKNNMIVIENLTNLELISDKSFVFSCLPLKYEKSDGSPVRAIAIEDIR
jgi:kynurenine formamidase